MNKNSSELRIGINIFIVLGVLTGVEYLLGLYEAPSIFLWIVGIVKAGLVVWFFMHFKRLFQAEEGDHS